MKYYKRFWDETTGEELTDSWGQSTFYLEVGSDLYVKRQMQIFENGYVLRYDQSYLDDEFGGLADKPLDEDDFSQFEIDNEEFETIWAKLKKGDDKNHYLL